MLWGCSQHDLHYSTGQQQSAQESLPQNFATEMDAGMRKMMLEMHKPGYSGNPDVDFLAMMIAHHEGAVEMARLVLMHGHDPLVRQLADEIITSQRTEIEAMCKRLSILRKGSDPNPEGFPALNGTRQTQQSDIN